MKINVKQKNPIVKLFILLTSKFSSAKILLMDAETINKRMKEEFDKNRTYDSLEKYAMSELLSPLVDYYSFMNIVKENLSLIKNMDLVFVAVDLEQMWTSESFF